MCWVVDVNKCVEYFLDICIEQYVLLLIYQVNQSVDPFTHLVLYSLLTICHLHCCSRSLKLSDAWIGFKGKASDRSFYFYFFDNAGLYVLQISICSNNSRGDVESNPDVPGQVFYISGYGLVQVFSVMQSNCLKCVTRSVTD